MERQVSNEVSMKKVKVVINGCGYEEYSGFDESDIVNFQITLTNLGFEWSYENDNIVNNVDIYRNNKYIIRVPKEHKDIEYDWEQYGDFIEFRREFVVEIPINEDFDPSKVRLITEQYDHKWWNSLVELNYIRYRGEKVMWNKENEYSVCYPEQHDDSNQIENINNLDFVIKEISLVDVFEFRSRSKGEDWENTIKFHLS